jgi:hypothetical protein
MMNEQIFWELIDKAIQAPNSNFETRCVTLTELLTAYSAEEILAFEHILRNKIEEASTWPVMAATFVVCSFISDDTYEDFRAWLVGQGREKFYKALQDPNEICNFLSPKEAEDLGGEYMLFVAVNAWLEKTGEEDEEVFYKLIEHPDEKIIKQQWPESKEAYRKLFPKLYDTFWNEDRIARKLEEAEGDDD